MATATGATLYGREADYDGFGTYTLGTENDVHHTAGTSATATAPDSDPPIVPKYARYRSFLDLDLSGVSVGNQITAISLNLYVETAFVNAGSVLQVYGCSAQEHAQSTAPALYSILNASNLYAQQQGILSTGAVSIQLGGQALTDAQALLGSGNPLTVCLRTTDSAGDSLVFSGQGNATSGHRPTATITYAASGTATFKAIEVLAVTEFAAMAISFIARESLRRF